MKTITNKKNKKEYFIKLFKNLIKIYLKQNYTLFKFIIKIK